MKNKLILALIILSVLINLFSFNKVQDWGDDFAGYIIQAQTISSGNFSGLENHMQRNDYILNYPWGFPLLISPLIGQFQSNIVLIKAWVFMFFILALVMMYFLFRKHRELGLVAVLFAASCPYFWDFKNYILADFPNLFLVLLVLFLTHRAMLASKNGIDKYLNWSLVGLSVFLSYLVRNQSIVLLPVIAITRFFVLGKKTLNPKGLFILLMPTLVFLVCLFIFNSAWPVKSVTYLNQYNNLQLGKTVWENIFYYFNVWKELFAITKVINDFPGVFNVFFLVFVLIGLFVNIKQDLLFVVFIFVSLALVLISPFHQGVRYLVPVVPFFFYFFVMGLWYSVSRLISDNKFKSLVFYSITGFIIFMSIKTIFVYSRAQLKQTSEQEGPYKKTSREMFAYLQNHSDKNDIIGFFKPRAMLLYTGRNAVVPGSFAECIKRRISYYVYYKKTTDEIPLDSLRKHADQFPEVFSNEDFFVFKAVNKKSSEY